MSFYLCVSANVDGDRFLFSPSPQDFPKQVKWSGVLDSLDAFREISGIFGPLRGTLLDDKGLVLYSGTVPQVGTPCRYEVGSDNTVVEVLLGERYEYRGEEVIPCRLVHERLAYLGEVLICATELGTRYIEALDFCEHARIKDRV